jgi:hypothetical protein
MAKLRTRIGEWPVFPTTTIDLPAAKPKPSDTLTLAILDKAARQDAERALLTAEVHIPDDHWPPAGRVMQHCDVQGCGICARLRSECWDYEA